MVSTEGVGDDEGNDEVQFPNIQHVMDNLIDYSGYIEKLIDVQSPVLIYAGEFDAQDGPKT